MDIVRAIKMQWNYIYSVMGRGACVTAIVKSPGIYSPGNQSHKIAIKTSNVMNSKTHEPTKSVELMTLYWNFFLSPLSSVSFSWSGKMERFHILSRIWECVAFIGNASAKSSH